jgi:hypothetical protein
VINTIGDAGSAAKKIDDSGTRPQVGRITERTGSFEELTGKLLPILEAKLVRLAQCGYGYHAVDSVLSITQEPAFSEERSSHFPGDGLIFGSSMSKND